MYSQFLYNPYNSSLNPAQAGNPYQPVTKQEIIRVNGENGAKAFQMPPNSSALLLDEAQPLIWLKQTDGAGYPTVTAYKIEPYTPEATAAVSSDLERRVKKLEEIINESYSVNASEFKSRKSSESDHVNQKHDERAERR